MFFLIYLFFAVQHAEAHPVQRCVVCTRQITFKDLFNSECEVCLYVVLHFCPMSHRIIGTNFRRPVYVRLCVSVPPLSLHEQGILHFLSATIYVQQEAVLNIDFCCSPVLILSLSSRGCLCVCSCLRAVKR